MAKSEAVRSESNMLWSLTDDTERPVHEIASTSDRASYPTLPAGEPNEKRVGAEQTARAYSNNADIAQGNSRMRSTSITTADGTTVSGIVQSQNRGQETLTGAQGSRHTVAPPDSNSPKGYLINSQGERSAIVSRKPIDGFDAIFQSTKPVKPTPVESSVTADRKVETIATPVVNTKSVQAETPRQQSLAAEGPSRKLQATSEHLAFTADNGNKVFAESKARATAVELRRASENSENVIASVDKVSVARDRSIFQEPIKLGRTAGEVVLTNSQPMKDASTTVSNRCEARTSERGVSHTSTEIGSSKNDAGNSSTTSHHAKNEAQCSANMVSPSASENTAIQSNYNAKAEVMNTKHASTVDAAITDKVSETSDKSSEWNARREIAFKSATESTPSNADAKTFPSTVAIGKSPESDSTEDARDAARIPDHGVIDTILTMPENLVSGRRGPDFNLADGRTSKTVKGEKSPGASAAPKLDISLAVKLSDSNTKKTTIDLIKMLEQGKINPNVDDTSKRLAGVARQIGTERLADLRQLIEKSENGRPPRFEGLDEKTLSAYRRILTLIMEQISGERRPPVLAQHKAGESKAGAFVPSDTNPVIIGDKNVTRGQRIERQPRPEISEPSDVQIPVKRRLDFVKELLGAHPKDNTRESYRVRFGDTLRSIALKHPQMQDARLWTLLAKLNTISIQQDSHGAPRAMLAPGRNLMVPDAHEIKQFQNENQNEKNMQRIPICCFLCKAPFASTGSVCTKCRQAAKGAADRKTDDIPGERGRPARSVVANGQVLARRRGPFANRRSNSFWEADYLSFSSDSNLPLRPNDGFEKLR